MKGTLKPAEILARARELETSFAPGGAVRLAVLSSFTAEFLRPYVIVEADALGLQVLPWFGPFGGFEPQVLDPASALWAERRDLAWLAMRIEDVDPELAHEWPALAPAVRADRVRGIRERLVMLAREIRARSAAYVLVSNLICPPTLDVFDANDPDGLAHVVAAENRELARALAALPGAHVLDWTGLCATDPRLWYLARAALSAEAQPVVARRLARSLRAMLVPAAKCVVVDLDGTLWGGVLGDDGPEGIQLGEAHPGRAYRDLQRALAQLKRRGFLLAIASKNDPDLVKDTLAHHPEMVLRPTDFAAILANWEPKALNLRRIAEALHLGLDALVLLDDNPVERAHVRAELPMVHVVELPSDPALVPAALGDIALFDRPRLLDDDRARAAMVETDAARSRLESAAPTMAEFLAQLDMVATIGACDRVALERVHQLIHKTNQFNLTTRRHPLDEVARLARSPEARVLWLRLRDRFGDLGLVCVGILRQLEDAIWEIDTFLMSCRVMGRKVEQAFLAELCAVAARAGAHRVRGLYLPTAKNHIVAGFYREHGFAELAGGADGARYEIDLAAGPPAWPACIARQEAASP